MNKDFSDFLKYCDTVNWSTLGEDISNTVKAENFDPDMFNANLNAILTVLYEYHKWLTSNN